MHIYISMLDAGSSLQNFQWAGGFGDRMLANLEAARCISVVEDIPDGCPDFVSPLSSEVLAAPSRLSNPSRPRARDLISVHLI